MVKKKLKDMTEKDWESWGKAFGERMEKKGKKFEKKMDSLGDEFECGVEDGCKKWEFSWSNKLGVFSFIGPLIGSIFGLIFLLITIFVLNIINIFLGSTFVTAFVNFFNNNLAVFFLASLVLGYAKFLTKTVKPIKPFLSPLVGIGGFVFALWVLANIFLAINVSANIGLIQILSDLLLANLLNIFVVLVVFAYLMKLLWLFVREIYW